MYFLPQINPTIYLTLYIQTPNIVSILGVVGVFIIALLLIGLVLAILSSQQYKRLFHEQEIEIEKLKIGNQQGELVAQMASVLSTTLDYRDVLQKMIKIGAPAMGPSTHSKDASEVVGLAMLFQNSDESLNIVAGHNIANSDKDQLVSAKIKMIDQAIHEAEAVINHNVQGSKGLKALRSLREFKSAVCAPLRVGLDTYGVVLFATKAEDFYEEGHQKLLTTLCSQVVIPLENAQLIEDLKREQQKILAKEEEARRKLARDLHDGPTQSIATIAMRLNFIKQIIKHNDIPKAQEEIIKVEEIAQKTTHEIRTMLFAMRPVVLETKGLVPALEGFAERLNATESFKVLVRNQGYASNLPPDKEGVLFAIVEEAVGNAKKHARATEIKITVAVDKKIFIAEIKDNGVGFDVDKTRATYDQRSSLGMINLFERSEAIGGKCEIDSAAGKGTAVRITVPL